ncbi:hypothetical protein EI546_14810 [Aequorivita sp. H23M31]|uniref:Uncharacterized protein n=1 Tax=Aequorivita ciconiae TaxID=2494375 RepID=A0A410G6I7_9FLAO|nr:hypothetical protein [Aequorivita sp. H23M31]QAA82909.1 hypothetical protein EI546_14810 [Aequorivita sp. H23M31]
MSLSLFNPFDELIFDEHFCFLSGDLTNESISVFPEWLLEHFKFGDERIEMMDKEKSYIYSDLRLPASQRVISAFKNLDKKIQAAFKNGFDGMSALEEVEIFQWSGRIVYGLLYYEMLYEKQRLQRQGREFSLSPYLRERFGNFHLMLQSLIAPVSFEGKKPWSIVVFPLKYSADIFSYRDDTVNLLFSMGVNAFGIIVCFRDGGLIAEKESDILEKMKGHVLHPIQFEELYARFHYDDYIMQYKPEFEIEESDTEVIIQTKPIELVPNKPLFGNWTDDMFAQLKANYWSVYGIEREDILQFQKPPLSYLENPYTKDFVDPKTIELPF